MGFAIVIVSHDMTRMSCNGTTGKSEACHVIGTPVSFAAKEQQSSKQENHSRSVVDPDQGFFRWAGIGMIFFIFSKIKKELKHGSHENIQVHTEKKQFYKGNVSLFFTATGQKTEKYTVCKNIKILIRNDLETRIWIRKKSFRTRKDAWFTMVQYEQNCVLNVQIKQ